MARRPSRPPDKPTFFPGPLATGQLRGRGGGPGRGRRRHHMRHRRFLPRPRALGRRRPQRSGREGCGRHAGRGQVRAQAGAAAGMMAQRDATGDWSAGDDQRSAGMFSSDDSSLAAGLCARCARGRGGYRYPLLCVMQCLGVAHHLLQLWGGDGFFCSVALSFLLV